MILLQFPIIRANDLLVFCQQDHGQSIHDEGNLQAEAGLGRGDRQSEYSRSVTQRTLHPVEQTRRALVLKRAVSKVRVVGVIFRANSYTVQYVHVCTDVSGFCRQRRFQHFSKLSWVLLRGTCVLVKAREFSEISVSTNCRAQGAFVVTAQQSTVWRQPDFGIPPELRTKNSEHLRGYSGMVYLSLIIELLCNQHMIDSYMPASPTRTVRQNMM